jgi:hypothetical protein
MLKESDIQIGNMVFFKDIPWKIYVICRITTTDMVLFPTIGLMESKNVSINSDDLILWSSIDSRTYQRRNV